MDEEVWRDAFDSEIEERGVPHVWSFYVDDNHQKPPGWMQYTQCTFARFQCSCCSRWWNSAKVHIVFLIKLDKALRRGTVRMKVFRQECKRCSSAMLEKANVDRENIERAISNLVSRIQSKVYKQSSGHQDLRAVVFSDNREGPHDTAHCEACQLGVCQRQVVIKEPER
ncbi:hypothetical protein FKM82_026163, partial [Ascaphus truei]